MKLNKNLEIALVSIAYLRKATKPISAAELAVVTNSTVFFVQKVISGLGRAGFIKTVKGPGGGYTVIGTEKISAYAVAEAVGQVFPTFVVGDKTDGSDSPVYAIERSIVNAFSKTAV